MNTSDDKMVITTEAMRDLKMMVTTEAMRDFNSFNATDPEILAALLAEAVTVSVLENMYGSMADSLSGYVPNIMSGSAENMPRSVPNITSGPIAETTSVSMDGKISKSISEDRTKSILIPEPGSISEIKSRSVSRSLSGSAKMKTILLWNSWYQWKDHRLVCFLHNK